MSDEAFLCVFFLTFLHFIPIQRPLLIFGDSWAEDRGEIRASLNYHRLMSELIITNVG